MKYAARSGGVCVSKKLSVGAIIDRPRIFPKQNPSP